MADLHDALAALHAADDARRNAQAYGGAIEDGRESDAALAVLLATEAWCAELRALTVTADYLAQAWCAELRALTVTADYLAHKAAR